MENALRVSKESKINELFANPSTFVLVFPSVRNDPLSSYVRSPSILMEMEAPFDGLLLSGKEVRAHPSHLFLIILLYGAMGIFWPRTDESSGVENTSLWSCIRKTAL